jgi:hypothetical protein
MVGVRVALSLVSFQTVRAGLVRMGKPSQGMLPDTGATDVQKRLWAVEVTGHYLLRERPCLTKALVAQMLLSRRGYQTILRIGVAHSSDRSLQAHAWLERNGEIIVGRLHDLGRFTPLPPLEMDTSRLRQT